MRIFTSLIASLVFILNWSACDNPAKGKAKAKVGEAKIVSDSPAEKGQEVITLDSKTVKVNFVGSKVTGKHSGSFGNISGSITSKGNDPKKARLQIVIKMESVTSDNDRLTGHLKSKDFFYVEKYPEARFVSTEIVEGGEKGASHTITGNLTLRGVTKSISFPATISGNKTSIKATTEFWINRRQFGINFAGMANDLIRDEVVLQIEINAKRPS